MSPDRAAPRGVRRVGGPVIGVFGGSFDPVHRGHLLLAERARDQVPCDEIWFVPTAIAPHKPAGAHASPRHRLEMLARAVEGRRGLKIEAIEVEAGVRRRTIETLRILAARHSTVQWHLILGEDSWAAIDSWVEPEALLDLAPAVVQARPGGSRGEPEIARRHAAHWLTGDPIDIASTDLRAALARGEDPVGLPPAVLDYVRAHGLYRERPGGLLP